MNKVGAAFALAATWAAGANAHAATELRIGVIAHNIEVTDGKNSNKEPGPDIEAMAVFGAPHMLRWLGGPHPFLLLNVNTHGATSYAAGGLEWQWRFARRWKLAPGFGLAVHNGELDNIYPNGTPENQQFQDDHVLLGSRVLFHLQVGVIRELTDHWSAELAYEHMSNGQILHQGRNQGLDEAGLRLSYKFGR